MIKFDWNLILALTAEGKLDKHDHYILLRWADNPLWHVMYSIKERADQAGVPRSTLNSRMKKLKSLFCLKNEKLSWDKFDINKTKNDPISRLNGKTTYVYFMRSGDFIKIGCSINPAARVGDLRTASPTIKLIGYIPGCYIDERKLHKKFNHLHVDREWFRAEKELLDFIKMTLSSSDAVNITTAK